MTQTVPDISPLMPMHQDPLLVYWCLQNRAGSLIGRVLVVLGWGLLSQFPTFRYFPNLSALSKHVVPIEYHVNIWQVPCSSAAVVPVKYICDSNNLRGTFARSKNLLTEKLTNGSLVTPPLAAREYFQGHKLRRFQTSLSCIVREHRHASGHSRESRPCFWRMTTKVCSLSSFQNAISCKTWERGMTYLWRTGEFTNGQLRGKCFHLMTSSCSPAAEPG